MIDVSTNTKPTALIKMFILSHSFKQTGNLHGKKLAFLVLYIKATELKIFVFIGI